MQLTRNSHVVLLLMLFAITSAFAQPQISGELTGTMGPGEFVVVGVIEVPLFQTLTLLPGTEFRFNGSYEFNIFGNIQAIGTEDDSIKFIQGSGAQWNGFKINTLASDDIRFEYCAITGSDESGFYIYGNHMILAHSTIADNSGVVVC